MISKKSAQSAWRNLRDKDVANALLTRGRARPKSSKKAVDRDSAVIGVNLIATLIKVELPKTPGVTTGEM